MSCVTGVVWLILRLYHHATHENYLFDVKGNAIKTLLGFQPDGKKSLSMQHWKMIVLNISLAIENKLFFTLPYIFVFGWNKSYEVCTEAHTRCGALIHLRVSHPSRVPRVCFARPFTPEKCKTNYYCSTIFYIFSFIIMINCGIFFNLCSFTVSYQWILYSHLLHHKFVGNLRPSIFSIFLDAWYIKHLFRDSVFLQYYLKSKIL